MPPRILKAPIGVWFSCLTTIPMPVRAASSGQAYCGVGGMTACTTGKAASSSARVNCAIGLLQRQRRMPRPLRLRDLGDHLVDQRAAEGLEILGDDDERAGP